MLYIVDGDEGGRVHRDNLLEAGIDDSRILDLREVAEPDVTPEDFVEPSLYVDAVNLEGAPFWGNVTIPFESCPSRGRTKAVEQWCKERGLPVPGKVRVAQRLIEQSWRPLIDDDIEDAAVQLCTEEGREWLRRLHAQAVLAMEIER